MNRRNLFVLAFALILGLAFLARWMMQPHAPANPRPTAELSASRDGAAPRSATAPPVAAPSAGPPPVKAARPRAQGHTLRGRVYDESSGAGIAAASILYREADVARYEGDFRSRPQTKSANDGSFVLEHVPSGRITLDVYATDHESRDVDVIVSADTAPIDIALATGASISGRLVASDGVTPVAGSAGLYNLDQGAGGEGRTDENGTFAYQHLSPGRYQVTGRTAEGAASREVVLARNQRVDGIVLVLGAGRSIRGVVSGLRPEELQRVRVSVRREADLFGAEPDSSVDERGAYVLRGVRPGRLELVAEVAMRRQLVKPIVMPADSDVNVNIAFPEGARLSGRVTYRGKPVEGARVMPIPIADRSAFYYGALTSKDGRYEIDGLVDGEYRMVVENYHARSVRVSGDTVFDIDVPRAQLSGRVVEEGGKTAIAGVELDVWPAEPATTYFRQHNSSGEAGDFALSGVEPGELVLTAYKPGYELLRQRISYEAPVTNMTLKLRQDAGVEINARDAMSGRPLREVNAIEMIGDRNGSRLSLTLSAEGVGYLPGALAGSTFVFSTIGYAPVTVTRWNGRKLNLKLQRQTAE